MTASFAAAQAPVEQPVVPPPPETLADTGLSSDFVRDLLLKTLYVQGTRTGHQLVDAVCLPFPLIDDELLTLQQRRFVEVRGATGSNRVGYRFEVVGEGRDRARSALESSQYVGPAPVPLARYAALVAAQSVASTQFHPESMRAGFSHLVVSDQLLDALGPAVNSAKSLFLYGHPGNGKTAIAESIAAMMGGELYVPYAVEIDGQVMLVHDPVYHVPAGPDAADAGPGIEDLWLRPGHGYDRRFAKVKRPIVLTGGELTLDQLDLRYDPYAKIYQAPFQVKANGGVLIIDDFGRQRVPPRDLLNRWIVPLEKRVDFLTLHTGGKFPLPFDCLLIFATNLEPQDLVEEAFLRRIHYKVHVVDPNREQYEEIFRRCCAAAGLAYHAAAVEFIYREFYERRAIPPRNCHPRDVVSHILDIAKYAQTAPALTPELLRQACLSYFLDPTRIN
jgi:predicted ATPase with chaperone activity